MVAVLTIYYNHNMNVILAFGMSGAAPSFEEPKWVKNDLTQYTGNAQMQRRMYDYAQIISNFLSRMYSGNGNNAWRQWFQNHVRIEPMNEFNVNISGYPSFAAYLDSQVKSNIAAAHVSVNRVVASSILSGTNSNYLGWYWNTTNYDGYYQNRCTQGCDPKYSPVRFSYR